MKRFFVQKAPNIDFVVIEGSEHNHLANVLRCMIGEQVIIVCGDGNDYICEILQISKNMTRLKVIDVCANKADPQSYLRVYVGINKLDVLSSIVRNLNELGASELVLFLNANSNLSKGAINISKLQEIARQSCKQCQRSKPLQVRGVLKFSDVIDELRANQNAFFADEHKEFEKDFKPHFNKSGISDTKSSLVQTEFSLGKTEFCLNKEIDKLIGGEIDKASNKVTDKVSNKVSNKVSDKVSVVIGTAGGFTESERVSLGQVAESFSLGKRILRTETATIVTAVKFLCEMGEL